MQNQYDYLKFIMTRLTNTNDFHVLKITQSKEIFVMHVLQTTNEILFMHQYLRITLMKLILQFKAVRTLQQIQLSSKQIYKAQRQRSQESRSTTIYATYILTTCGDANAMIGTKHIDPALCLYVGALIMCIDNKHLKDKVPRGNGTIC